MSFLYFAYGSNMLPARLQARCSTARVIGTATAAGYEIEFTKPGKDGSGKATLVRSVVHNAATPGTLFEIEKSELHFLDHAESAGLGYERDNDFHVTLAATGETTAVTTYLAIMNDPDLEPFDWYLALILAGSSHHSLPHEHHQRLQARSYVVDLDHSRDGRTEALRALSHHGYDMSLLPLPVTQPHDGKSHD